MKSPIELLNLLPNVSVIEKVLNKRPVPAPRMVDSDKWKERPSVQRYFGYRADLRMLFDPSNKHAINNTHPYAEARGIEICAHFQVKNQQLWGCEHILVPDGDNLLKAVVDSLVFDDQKIAYWWCQKMWDYEDRVEIRLWGAK